MASATSTSTSCTFFSLWPNTRPRQAFRNMDAFWRVTVQLLNYWIVGAIILIYSTIWSDGIPTVRCHVCGWCVEPAYSGYATLFFAKDLKHKNITYLNISAKADTLPIIETQGFTRYSSGQFIAVPALQFAFGDNLVKVMGVDDVPTAPFAPFERDLLLAHAKYGCICFWCVTPARAYPFIFRPRFFKRFVPGVQLVYCSEMEHFVRFAGPIGRFLAWQRRKLTVRTDSNGPIPGLIGTTRRDRVDVHAHATDRS